ncbi:hypothetical protein GYD82_003732 [Salmonella enterica]|nr:hypothetical protein [Salmonella enterica]
MNGQRIKRLLIVSVILNAILIFLFVQALSGNINPKKDVEKVASNVPIISPLCDIEKEKHYKNSLEFFDDPDNAIEHNPMDCYWVNPITKKYFKFDKHITVIKGSTDKGSDYYKFGYFNTPFMNLVYAPAFISSDSMDDFKKFTMSVFKVRFITKGDYVKRGNFEKWTSSGFVVNKDGSDGDFVVLALIKKDNKFWLIYGYYNSRYKYNDKRTMKLIDDIIEAL